VWVRIFLVSAEVDAVILTVLRPNSKTPQTSETGMNPSDLPFALVPDGDWSQELAVQIWEVEGGKVPPDEEPPEPPLAPSVCEHASSKEPTNLNTR